MKCRSDGPELHAVQRTIGTLLESLRVRGIELWLEGSQLRFRSPPDVFTAELRDAVHAERSAIVAQLRSQGEANVQLSPLSYNQRSLWLMQQENPESAAYHVSASLHILSRINVAALRETVQALSDRHATLRTTYLVTDSGQLMQRIPAMLRVDVMMRDVPSVSRSELEAFVQAEHQRPFHLERGPVFRATLFSRDNADHVFLMTMHHIAGDAWSLAVLLEEFHALYAVAAGFECEPPSRVTYEYVQFVEWQEQMLKSPEGALMASRWQQTLASPRSQVVLPGDRPQAMTQAGTGATLRFPVTQADRVALRRVAREHGTTLYVVLLAAFKTLLYRLTGTPDIVVGTATAGRSRSEFARTVGHFVNPIPIRTRLHANLPFSTLLARVSSGVSAALTDQDYPLMLMVQHDTGKREKGQLPLFSAFFGLIAFDRFGSGSSDADERSLAQPSGLRCEPFPIVQEVGQFDLSLQFVERDGVLDGQLLYNAQLYTEATIEAVAEHYRSLLSGIAVNAQTSLERFPSRVDPLSHDAATSGHPDITSAQLLLDRLQARDIKVSVEGDKLNVNAQVGALNAELKSLLAANKTAIIELLSRSPTRGQLRRIPRIAPLPTSFAQQRLWFLDRLQPGNPLYNMSFACRAHGALDVTAFSEALDALPQRHEALRLRFREHDGSPYAETAELRGSIVTYTDLTSLPAADRHAEANRLAVAAAVMPFDLAHGPVIRCAVIRVTADEHLLLVCMHHIASDGWSLNVAAAEICERYEARIQRRAPNLRSLDLQYVDFASWQREQLHSGLFAQQLGYWRRQLAGAPVTLDLPTDRPRPAVASYRGHHVEYQFGPSLLEAAKTFARANNVTLYMVLLATWQVLLYRNSGQNDLVVGSPLANRDRTEFEGLIGCFMNTVAMRGDLSGNPHFTAFLSQIKSVVLGAFDHRELPFDRLVEGLRPERSMRHTPIFQVMLSLQSFPIDRITLPGVTLTSCKLDRADTGTSRFDLTLEMDEHEGQLRMSYEYATDLFDAATIARMHWQYRELLAAVLENPDRPIDDLPLVSATDALTLCAALNDSAMPRDRTRCVHQLVEAVATSTPHRVAVRTEHGTLTYGELDERANQMAHLLRMRGVLRGSLVGVCLDRTVSLPVALLAVHKAGAAYVPVDPSHPVDRVAYSLADAQVACVITESRFASLLPASAMKLLLVDADATELLNQPSSRPDLPCRSDDLAYVMYTSGSTGRPKGVEVEHRNVVNVLHAMTKEPGFDASDVLLAVTTLSFDIAGLEIFLPLISGASVVIASRDAVLRGETLASLIAAHDITVMQATPATWWLMLDAGWTGKPDLRAFCGGEVMPRELARRLVGCVGALWNMYGPTETTIWSTIHRVTDTSAEIAIGHAVGNTRLFVLDGTKQLVPIGVTGELFIGGEGVARGYRNRPELTAENFIVLSPAGVDEQRVYRTGDMVRVRGDLSLEFVGRRDLQVKLRGYRIEPGEIEAVLQELGLAERAVVLIREDISGDRRLVAYVVLASGIDGSTEAVRAALRTRLPEYMIPASVVALPAFPLTPSGKIDRNALPTPRFDGSSRTAAVELMTETQRKVARIWQEVLQVPQLRLHDNFFDVGGHSLLVVKVHSALRREFQQELALVNLFQHPTIAAQAKLVSDTTESDAPLQRGRSRAARQLSS